MWWIASHESAGPVGSKRRCAVQHGHCVPHPWILLKRTDVLLYFNILTDSGQVFENCCPFWCEVSTLVEPAVLGRFRMPNQVCVQVISGVACRAICVTRIFNYTCSLMCTAILFWGSLPIV